MKNQFNHNYLFVIVVLCLAVFVVPGKAQDPKTLYVTPGGNNANDCLTPATSCAGITPAIGKASAGDTVKIAAGSYYGSGTDVVTIDKSINLSGGWNTAFTSRPGGTVIDGQAGRRGIVNLAGANTWIDLVTVQGGKADEGSGISNLGNLTLTYAQVINNGCNNNIRGIGIYNDIGAALDIQWSTISGNLCTYSGTGGGIFNFGSLLLSNSTVSGNQADWAGGISNGAYGQSQATVIIRNSTISGNKSSPSYSGGGIANDGFAHVSIYNSTITENYGGTNGGGIIGGVLLRNSIIANNYAANGPDCYGAINSQGYNLVQETTGCSITAQPGDILGLDAGLGALANNGGPTQTYFLYADSPALDAGNPNGCKDNTGALFTTDQRGSPRPLDGNQDGTNRCDIGAFEANPNTLPPSPHHTYYVRPTGNDGANCITPTTPCKTINAAIGKAVNLDTIQVAAGTYTGSGTDVVTVNKGLTIHGGWDTAFTSQTGSSIIDGQKARRGLTINILGKLVSMDRFTVQNGKATGNRGGAGVLVEVGSKAVLDNFTVQDNTTDNNNPWSGGGIDVAAATLTLKNSRVIRNISLPGAGGGIYAGGTVTLDNVLVDSNRSHYYGGGILVWGETKIDNSTISNNSSELADGGGIYVYNQSVTLTNSRITGNSTPSARGGGLGGYDITVISSIISGNRARYGGGVYVNGTATIRDSAVFQNWATDGGAFTCGGPLYLVNTTVFKNLATHDGGASGYCTVRAYNATITANRAGHKTGGLDLASGTLSNTIVANNQAGMNPDLAGTFTSLGYNLIGSTSGITFTPAGGDLLNVDPGLNWPQGDKVVLAPRRDSLAVDGGNPAGCLDFNAVLIVDDQRGAGRPKIGKGSGPERCDIGAYELDPANLTEPAFIPYNAGPTTISEARDDFSSPWSGWPIIDDGNLSATYSQYGFYGIYNQTSGVISLITAPYQARTAYTLEVDVRYYDALNGTGTSHGVFFGMHGDFSEYYVFLINNKSGQYTLLRKDSGGITVIKPATSSGAIIKAPNPSSNHLKVTKSAGKITLVINNTTLGTWTDTLYPSEATFFGLAQGPDGAGADFDNFVIKWF